MAKILGFVAMLTLAAVALTAIRFAIGILASGIESLLRRGGK